MTKLGGNRSGMSGEVLSRRATAEDRARARELVALMFGGLLLWLFNNLGLLVGVVGAPGGHDGLLAWRGQDFAQYGTWMAGHRADVLLPDYHAPWITAPALFNPVLFILARLAAVAGLSDAGALTVFHAALHVAFVFGVRAAIRDFVGPGRTWSVLGFLVAAVPVTALLAIPSLVVPQLETPYGPPGLALLLYEGGDGAVNGVAGSPLVTFGTVTAVWALVFLGRRLRTGSVPALFAACIVTFISAWAHPFEVFVICGAGTLVLALTAGAWSHALLLASAGALGLLPHVVSALRSDWVQEVARNNHWAPGSSLTLLLLLGLPLLAALLLSLRRPAPAKASDRLLQAWVGVTLVGVYVPRLPHSQHLLDGLHVAVALLLVRQLDVAPLRVKWRRMALGPATGIVLLAAGARGMLAAMAAEAGNDTGPDGWLFRATAASDELRLRSILADQARPGDLVLAPPVTASLLATAPVHALGSHRLFSITYRAQLRLAEAFYCGALTRDAAHRMLGAYGARWVVVPTGNPAQDYVRGVATLRWDGDSLDLFETPFDMQPRSASAAVEAVPLPACPARSGETSLTMTTIAP